MPNLFNSYQEFIQDDSGTSISKAQTYNRSEYIGFESSTSFSHAEVPNVIDCTDHKYLYIEPKFKKLLGYDKETLSITSDFTQLWNRNDFKIFNEKLFPETIDFLKKYSVSDYPSFSFSFNYRVKAKDGKDYTLLQKSTYFSDTEDGNGLTAVGSIVDITNYKTDTSIVHTVEKTDPENPILSRVPLFKSVYYPDKTDDGLSKRELEILAAIYEGMCSKQIAEKFFLSINTVNNHRKNMLHKTNTNNASELIRYAMNNGLL